MAQYRHLPVWKAALDLAVHLERAVWRFSRYNKYTLGSDLRRTAQRLWRLVAWANDAKDAARLSALDELVGAAEEMKTLLTLAQDAVGAALAAMPTSQPNRIPMGVSPNRSDQTGAYRIGDEVACDMPHIFTVADGAIMETSLPDRHAERIATAVNDTAAARFVAFEQAGEGTVAQLQQPVQVVGHQHEGECGAQPRFVASAQFPYRQSGQTQIGEQRQAIFGDRSDEISPPDFRATANAQVAAMGMCFHGGDHARSGGGVSIAAKAAPTKNIHTIKFCRRGFSPDRRVALHWEPTSVSGLAGQTGHFKTGYKRRAMQLIWRSLAKSIAGKPAPLQNWVL